MGDLNFRITIVPKEPLFHDKIALETLLSNVKQRIMRCASTTVVNLALGQVKKSDNDDYPEIEELVIQVQVRNVFFNNKIAAYKAFLQDWKQQYDPVLCTIQTMCAYIVLYENDSFQNSRRKSSSCNIGYDSISFGVLPHNGQFHKFAVLFSHSSDFINFFHDTRDVSIRHNNQDMVFKYDNIRAVFVDLDSQTNKIYFDLFNPPMVFRVDRRTNRATGETYTLKYRAITVQANRYTVDRDILGRANILCLSFKNQSIVEEIISCIHHHCSEKPIYYSTFLEVDKEKPSFPNVILEDFNCHYLLTALFKRNFVVISQASKVLDDMLNVSKLCNENAESLGKALAVVLAALDSGKIINFWHVLVNQYQYYLSNKDEIAFSHYLIPEKCRIIRRVTLTPTRVLLWPPEVMLSNRILRNFDSEYALRVSFRDDNMSRLSFNAAYADDDIFQAAIVNHMSIGINVGSRKFEFLAWSNSQIRDHGVWMYAKDKRGNTASDIRTWMGDFSHIHTVPKYMARMGQCFSQTEDALGVPLDPQHIKTEDDIEGGYDFMNRKPYCFSDGIGKISSSLANQVHNALGHDKLCSAFQIRYGGYKGMLVIDPTLRDVDIVFRKSMKKFDAPKTIRLEIARTSAPGRLQLNRPLITLLNAQGVRHRTFLKLQDEMLKRLTDMLFDENKASEFLESATPSDLFSYKELSQSGIFLTAEPFFRSLLLALHRHHIENIKTRANIAVDPDYGRNMLGVLDETGRLKYGEVFIKYTRDISDGQTNRDTKVLKGTVLVTKNPCLHPGDVRKFKAVDVPQLHHIVDCIVFPQCGSRPHPNEMAGSDLDGDEYAVIWQPDLIFHKTNDAPGDFPSVEAELVHDVNVGHMISFLVKYIKNDQVGILANAHLAHADNLGIHASIPLTIAKKFSVAVDFAKNGKSENLDRSERPTTYPDFMEKNHREVYKSQNALGKMYRVCIDFESENQSASTSYKDIQVDPDLIYPGWQRYEENAIMSRNKYNSLLRTVLRNYGILHEAEVFSGAFTNLHCRFQERKDRAEIEKVIIKCMKKLSKCMHEEFLEEFENSANTAKTHELMFQKASAWYIVTYSDKDAKFLSFPWILSKYLANIKITKTLGNVPAFAPAVLNMDEQINLCVAENKLPVLQTVVAWNAYAFYCDQNLVRKALQVMIIWAQDEQIISKPGYEIRGTLYYDVFVKLFLFVAEKAGYISKSILTTETPKRLCYSAASLCLEFLRFCMTLRFYNKNEIGEVIPFPVYKYSQLAKKAVVSYHMFALSGKFMNLYFEKISEKEITDMKPINIDSKIFPRIPIDNVSLQNAERALIKYSRVEDVTLREITQTKKVCVKAWGSEQSLKALKSILRKKHVFLRALFTTGVMPEY
ncbi:uncharacterized protein LOC129234216 isoform X1 [Uloborus diversus]|uniref:uncharacterized protein LOC129234216 isoform X1 n=1 Tax=Uloborus diversus TaxID=327109 RepID=UPI00240A02F2|nr:uncharacterized protein LOC129234216 isoform X1 [Uloborus diversus]